VEVLTIICRIYGSPAKSYDETEQVLEILQSARSRWRQLFADCVAPDRVAETVAKIKPAGKPQIDSNVRAKGRTGGGKFVWRKAGRTSGRNQSLSPAGKMNDSGASPEVWPDAAVGPTEVNHGAEDDCMLRTPAILLIEGSAI